MRVNGNDTGMRPAGFIPQAPAGRIPVPSWAMACDSHPRVPCSPKMRWIQDFAPGVRPSFSR